MTVEHTRVLRVVLVSPGDVPGEREVAQRVVEELNRGIAADRGCRLCLWRWETDARPGLHLEGPQGLIDEEMHIKDADVVVGVFWKRFGTPTRDADSGTEHELRRAWVAWRQNKRPDVMVYFCARAYSAETLGELAQHQRVLEFRQELPEEQLWWRYTEVAEFERLLREHLTGFIRERIKLAAPQPAGPPRAQRRVRFNLPAVAAAFQGRERELAAVDEAFALADRAVITQAIGGLGGVGKSQLAARYVHQHADCYDVAAWIRAEEGGIADLALLAAKLGEPVAGLSPSERAQIALDWLGDSERPWLLVLDNIASPDQLERLLPGGGAGRVLVTSRDRALRQFGPVLTLDVLDEDAATAYLIDRASRPLDAVAARELARELGCLPLALSHAAAYCQSGTSFAVYRELLAGLPARELFDGQPDVFYAETVASTWKVSIDAANRQAPLAADVLALAAYLAPDAIPKHLFRVLVKGDDSAQGSKPLADAFNALARFSLASVDDSTLGTHRLLQKTIRDDISARDDQSTALCALAAVGDVFPRDTQLPATWPLCEQLLPHVLALADALDHSAVADRIVELLNRACSYLNYAQAGERSMALAERVHALAERMRDVEHIDALGARHNLAVAYADAGRTEDAISAHEALLADSQRILGADHASTLRTRHNLAIAYWAVGRTQDGLAFFKALLADRQRIIGAKHPDTLSSRANLAIAQNAAGPPVDAIAIDEALLADHKEILGVEHPNTLRSRRNLAVDYLVAGRTQDAITILEPLLADRERILGVEHPDTLRSRTDLADAYDVAGRSAEAARVRRGGGPPQ